MLAEDAARTCRIDAVEAQYYRAILHEEWGEGHLAWNGQQFRSGASCRDLSLVLPFTRIAAHAPNLAEAVGDLDASGRIAVWRRDIPSGAMSAFRIEVAAPLYVLLAPFTLVWDAGLRAKLRAIRGSALPAETGGVLLGYHDFNEGRIFVVDVLPAPPDSLGTPAGFRRGIEGLAAQLDGIRASSGGQVSYLGEWHSHPDGAGARPSGDDLTQLLYLRAVLSEDGLPGLQLIVADEDEQWLLVR
jgi:integrative and conjugative element protein (TIGR02256 family)